MFRAVEHSSSVVTIHPSLADVQEGQSLELNCHAPGNPPPRVTWTRASGQLSSNHQVVTQKQMQNRPDFLRNSDISSGVWSTVWRLAHFICVKCCFDFLLYVWTVLAWKFILFLIVLCWNVCVAICRPQSLPRTQRKKLDWSQWPVVLQVRGNQLRILSATPEDSGDYICRVQGNTRNPVPHVHQSSVSVSVTSSSSRKSARKVENPEVISSKKYNVWKCFSSGFVHSTELNCTFHRGNWSWW